VSDGTNGEDREERLNRELIEFLNELRVVLPGVQVLFAFLLTVPFTNQFQKVTNEQRQVYFWTFICTTIATALLIAPSVHHRLRWRQRDKERLLQTANRLSIGGMVFLTLALVGAVYLVTDLLFHPAAAAAVTAGIGIFFSWFWWGLPLWRFAERRNSS
jgi:predicted membrane channel-forming protein YqfA (hemolysin III family)